MAAKGVLIVLSVVLACVGVARASIIQQVATDGDRLAPGETLQISFRLATPADVTLEILDGDIQLLRAIPLGMLPAGKHTARWNGTDAAGHRVPADAYVCRILARADGKLHLWAPAYLRSRPAEAIWSHRWDPDNKVITLEIPSAMRGWLRIGLQAGACMRTLADGVLWPRGRIEVPWDGRDESGLVDLAGRGDWFITAFGYRIPSPSVIVTGEEPPAQASGMPFAPIPPVQPTDALWTRVRESCRLDRAPLDPRVTQTAELEFTLDAAAPQALRERILRPSVRVRWFIDGRSVAVNDLTALPATLQLDPEALLSAGAPHFVTANIETSTDQVYVATCSIPAKE